MIARKAVEISATMWDLLSACEMCKILHERGYPAHPGLCSISRSILEVGQFPGWQGGLSKPKSVLMVLRCDVRVPQETEAYHKS
jgi:hypothetical protein